MQHIMKTDAKQSTAKQMLMVVLFCTFFPAYTYAQTFQRFDYLPVTANGTTLRYPWTGGVNSVQFGKADVDRDGKIDLVVYDKSNRKYLTFLTISENSTNYVFDNHYAANFPPVSGWMIMKDYNCDGIEDIFTYNGIANAMVYTGYYSGDTLRYRLQQNGFFYQANSGTINVYCSDVIKPAIADVNGDGDLDMISFNVFGNRLIYYENQQKEARLSCDSLFFAKADNCWGNVRDSFAASYALQDTCTYKFDRQNGNEQTLHTGSSIEAIDIERNGSTDLLIGSVSLDNLTMLYNYGNRNYASVLLQDVTYPNYNIPFNTSSFGVPVFLDADNNGTTDLLVSTFDEGAANVDNIWYYKNSKINGSRSIRVELQQKDFLLDNMIDAGENSNPCFMDVDGDGLTDILLGSGGYKDNINAAVCKLLYYKNTGTISNPAFNLENDDFLGIRDLGVKDLVPAAGDMDNDLDMDLLIGLSDGRMICWENTAATGSAPNLIYRGILKDSSGSNISIGTNAAPFLVDINRDGKTDLIIGERNGNLNYYRGTMTTAAKFSFVTDSLGKVRIKTNGISIGYTQPCVSDVNNDGKYDLILGTNINGLLLYDNIEDHLDDTFSNASPVLIDNSDRRSTAAISDISGDGKPELLTGNINGGLIIYSLDSPPFIPTGIRNPFSEKLDFDLYPNPANNQLYIDINGIENNIQVQVYSLIGQLIATERNERQHHLELNTTAFPNGMYLVKIKAGQKEGTQKVIIQH